MFANRLKVMLLLIATTQLMVLEDVMMTITMYALHDVSGILCTSLLMCSMQADNIIEINSAVNADVSILSVVCTFARLILLILR